MVRASSWAWLAIFGVTAPAFADERSFVGYAYGREGGALLYTEHHRRVLEGGRLISDEVSYRSPDGRVIATKTLDHSRDPARPSFRMEDARDGSVEGANVEPGWVELYERRDRSEPMKRERLPAPERFAIDAGFGHLVNESWSALMAGETVRFDFAAPARLDFYTFRIVRADEDTVRWRDALVLRVEPESAVLRWLVEPITLRYDLETRELLEWVGVSNIADERGRNYEARIVFPNGEGNVAGSPTPTPVSG